MKRIYLLLLLTVLFVFAGNFSLYAADNISGTWAMLNDKTGRPDCYVLFHTHGGTLYGRIIVLVDGDTGLVVDTLALEKERDQDLAGCRLFADSILFLICGIKAANGKGVYIPRQTPKATENITNVQSEATEII